MGIESVFFNFTTDILIKREGIKFLLEYLREMEKIGGKIRTSGNKINDWNTYIETRELPEEYLDDKSEYDPDLTLNFFRRFYRRISDYTPEFK